MVIFFKYAVCVLCTNVHNVMITLFYRTLYVAMANDLRVCVCLLEG
jgi:hypothetical protein